MNKELKDIDIHDIDGPTYNSTWPGSGNSSSGLKDWQEYIIAAVLIGIICLIIGA